MMTVLSCICIIILYSTASLTYSDYCIIYIDSLSYRKHVLSPSCVIYLASRPQLHEPNYRGTSNRWHLRLLIRAMFSHCEEVHNWRQSVAAHLQPLCDYSLYHTYSNYSITRMHLAVYRCDAVLYYLLTYYTYASLSPYRCSYNWN